MAIVTTGQITIVDQNDARPISAALSVAPGIQQTWTMDDSTAVYTPDWTTVNSNAGVRITPKVYVGGIGGSTEVTGQLTNRKFTLVEGGASITGSAALISSNASMASAFVSGAGLTFTVVHDGTGSTFTIKSNMLPATGNQIVYFEGDYTDSVTSLTVKVYCSVNLSVIKTGTNAVYVMTSGKDHFKKSTGTTKEVVAIKANLVRPGGIDVSGLEFRWFESNGATQISTSSTAGMFALKNVAEGSAVTAALSDLSTPNLPAPGAWTAIGSGGNTLVIHENAVTDIGIFRVEIRDTANSATVWQTFFTITDQSDPYRLELDSSTGDKLNNGVGTTVITPIVYNGGTQVSNLTGWEFIWTPYNRNGKRGAFIDASRTAYGSGRDITSHTTGTSATITYSGAVISTPAISTGDIIKVVTTAGLEAFYEVSSGASNTVTIRTPSTNAWLNFTDFPSPTTNQFTGGKFYVCTVASGNAARGQRVTSGAATITLTGDEVDSKIRLVVTGDRP